jgi:predicted AAA+ superfamily ATPase
MGPFDRPEEVDGAALETLLYQQLCALNDYLDLGYTLFYWRTISQLEVDFVLYGPKGLIAFEIKRSSSISDKDLKGLKAFALDYPESKLFLFYGGTRREYIDSIELIPIEEGLRQLASILKN